MEYSEFHYTAGWGECGRLRLNSEASSRVYDFFDSNKYKGLKFVPETIKKADSETLKLFLETFLKGDGEVNRKRTTTVFKELADDLMEIAIKAGWSATQGIKRGGPNNKQVLYYINFITTENSCFTRFNYSIWLAKNTPGHIGKYDH